MMNRRDFLQRSAALAGSLAMPALFSRDRNSVKMQETDLTILYTNDTHARIEPFPENARRFAGLGGIARRASLIDKVRQTQKNVLLLDAGDIFHGTPWFDVYGGSVDLDLMTRMGYDAAAIGNHEFDRGPDGFAEAAQKAGFPFLAANYDVRNTPMNPFVERFIVREFSGFRVGIFGLGIGFSGLIDSANSGDVRAYDPIRNAETAVESLKEYYRCDIIICLSHLGFSYIQTRNDDLRLTERIQGIDIIIGGHTHTFMEEPLIFPRENGSSTLITHMGHSGVRVGRIDVSFGSENSGSPFSLSSRYYTIGDT
ncbi:MAG: twin-arginine translocation signal domain-containing protein [Balneolaceae bacterium]|nr:MAG: twin-arginine translocation signal domain-containing protein [Balneolaceae bacterium]